MLYYYIGAQVESDPSLAEVQDVNNPWYVSMVNSMITTDYTPHKSFSLNLIVNNFNTIQNVVADSYPTLIRNCAPINVDSKALHDSSNSDKEVSLHLPTVLQKEIALLEPIASLLPAVYEFPSFDLTPTEFIPQILKQIYINSGAAISIVNDKSLLRNVKHTNARIAGFDGKPTLADGIGTLSILGMELECLYVKKCKENILSIRDLTNHGRTVCFVNNKTFILPTANLQDNEIQDHLSKFANEQHQQNKLINSSSNDKSDVYRAVLRANLNNPSHYFIKALHEQNIN
ncbi:hypothetical protein C6P42_004907 [Pichia californica]|nr:hypothetical protein C6P42_004907 [[Candida] californica]